jgi:hypothetical protein
MRYPNIRDFFALKHLIFIELNQKTIIYIWKLKPLLQRLLHFKKVFRLEIKKV